MNGSSPIDVALQFIEQISRQNLDGLAALMTADHTFIDMADDVHRGRETMRQGWADYFQMCPHYMIHVTDLYQVGNKVIIIGRTTGSHVQQPRHVEIQDTLIWIAGIENGRLATWIIVADTAQNRSILGATPAHKITR